MTQYLDFSLSSLELASLLMVPLFPALLSIIARVKAVQNRNALQLCLTSVIMIFLWGGIVYCISVQDVVLSEIVSSLMIFVTILLVYVEIWALLSRGYTLGILLTLNECSVPLDDKKLAQSYRSGEGLEWLIHHRFSGLFATKLIFKNDNKIFLTSFPGRFVVSIYKLFIDIFSLKRTG